MNYILAQYFYVDCFKEYNAKNYRMLERSGSAPCAECKRGGATLAIRNFIVICGPADSSIMGLKVA